ncbi:GTP cyclohydrolase 1 type 2/Nif3 [Carpediemonas membranifera]|uniref:GTP cyclohydrolase 1 type 2/Nif3 n=1 Tax=Carpediemonas membranifera TaxID=201153 RepID=A0A8J6E000_9EUKA|nr:GTP cyclohydrolase 1 type 2/Nif3 [Carpediemonas membranifera]|eukprot:KAG9391448.1 GTP cyclohydrolase 1 type 2/Nif3 [Carpediemonas membranifera]
MATVGSVEHFINEIIPPTDICMENDPIGLHVGDRAAPVTKVLVCLDVDADTLAEAKEHGCEMILAHHPLIFRPLKDVVAGNAFDTSSLVFDAVRSGVAIMTAHTNLDKSDYGTNAAIASAIGYDYSTAMPIDATGLLRKFDAVDGTTTKSLAQKLACKLNVPVVNMTTTNANRPVASFAMCSGAGFSFLSDVVKSGADLFITGDVGYHEAQAARAAGVDLIDIQHYSEGMFMEVLVPMLNARGADERGGVEFIASKKQHNVWTPITV